MNRNQALLSTTLDAGDWRPRYWTLACVSTCHLILAATLITATPKPLAPLVVDSVDIVTFPDGTSTTPTPNVPNTTSRPAVDLLPQKQEAAPTTIPKFGPRPTDKRTKPAPITPPNQTEPTPPAPDLPEIGQLAPKQALPIPPPPPVPTPVPPPTPIPVSKQSQTPPALPVPAAKATPTQRAEPVPVPVPAPALVPPEPIVADLPEPARVEIKNRPSSPSLITPTAEPISIRADRLKLKQNQTLKSVDLKNVPLAPTPNPVPAQAQSSPPPAPAPAANPTRVASPSQIPSQIPSQAPSPPPAQQATRTPSPPPPAFVLPTPQPLAPITGSRALPKVQVPRINAADLRVPEIPAAGGVVPTSPTNAPTAGVTSLGTATTLPSGRSGGGAAGGGPTRGGSGPGGSSGPGGGTGLGGAGSIRSGSNAGGGPGSSAGGPSGVLPRRPGGASVRQPFPRGDGGTLLDKMDRTYDCSRLNRERDARCPDWDPIEGRNSRPTGNFEVPVPKGLPKPRYAPGTNPMPLCPPGTPGSQYGLSCLPGPDERPNPRQ